VTHGSEHEWLPKLALIGNYLKRAFVSSDSKSDKPMDCTEKNCKDFEVVEKIIDEIIPINIIERKLY
jgi:hypothetical protein